jgi:transposase-like protein
MLILKSAEAPHIVESENVVRVRMGQEHRVDALNAERKYLIAEIRRRVENQMTVFSDHVEAATVPLVFEVGG